MEFFISFGMERNVYLDTWRIRVAPNCQSTTKATLKRGLWKGNWHPTVTYLTRNPAESSPFDQWPRSFNMAERQVQVFYENRVIGHFPDGTALVHSVQTECTYVPVGEHTHVFLIFGTLLVTKRVLIYRTVRRGEFEWDEGKTAISFWNVLNDFGWA